MRIDLPQCNLKTCRYSSDGNCTDRNRFNICEYTLAKKTDIDSLAYIIAKGVFEAESRDKAMSFDYWKKILADKTEYKKKTYGDVIRGFDDEKLGEMFVDAIILAAAMPSVISRDFWINEMKKEIEDGS